MDRGWILATLLAATAVFSSQAQAQEQLPDRFALKVGGFFITDSDTAAAVRSSTGVLGTSVSFDRDLGGDQSTTAPRVDGYFRFNQNNRIDFSWYKFQQEGSRGITREITFRNQTFPVNARVDSTIDTQIWKLAYAWSFYHSDKVELLASLGIHYMDFSMELRTPRTALSQTAAIKAPLPVWGLGMDYAITPRWHVLARSQTFYVELNNDLKGELGDVELKTEYRFGKHFAIGAGLNRTTLSGTIDNDTYRGALYNRYRGYMLYGAFYF